MQTLQRVAAMAALMAALLVGCATVAPAPADSAAEETGVASYYSDALEGRPTASGEPYRRDALTAAHRTLPFGSLVEVTSAATGRAVTVRINDRGPSSRGRIIDLSRAAAEALGMIAAGVVQVRLRVLRLGP